MFIEGKTISAHGLIYPTNHHNECLIQVQLTNDFLNIFQLDQLRINQLKSHRKSNGEQNEKQHQPSGCLWFQQTINSN